MGVISDFIAASNTIDNVPPITALDRRAYRELMQVVGEGDFVLPTALAAADEVQSIAINTGTVSGGTFTLTVTLLGVARETTAIAYDANAAAMETAIDVAASPTDEVQSLAVYSGTVSGGTFTLTVTLANAETCTTANIAYDAAAATIETAIDVAATSAALTGWTNGDISVSGGDLNTNPVVLTYDGTSVAALNHSTFTVDGALLTGGGAAGAITVTTQGFVGITGWTNGDISVSGGDLNTNPVVLTYDGTLVTEINQTAVTIDGTLLTGGGAAGAVTVTTDGQSDRPGYAVLTRLGIVTGTVPGEGIAPTALTQAATVSERRLSPDTIKAVALDISITEENNDIYAALVTAAGL